MYLFMVPLRYTGDRDPSSARDGHACTRTKRSGDQSAAAE
ncbi:hypothetical protein FM105_06890 [Brevibacterium yomogidense]|uniref:Uncharacterized protein n=1 Tax=Brevibacterium yomogidense TaxID=946573 RepID=A0A1X6XDG6_9MICO|nr:hypothetical protein FM105_06890 [Brevibacterium yomogidense]